MRHIVIGSSPDSWEAAARNALGEAANSLPGSRCAEVIRLEARLEDGRVVIYRAKLAVSVGLEPGVSCILNGI